MATKLQQKQNKIEIGINYSEAFNHEERKTLDALKLPETFGKDFIAQKDKVFDEFEEKKGVLLKMLNTTSGQVELALRIAGVAPTDTNKVIAYTALAINASISKTDETMALLSMLKKLSGDKDSSDD